MGRNALLIGAAEGHVKACRALLERSDFLGVNSTNNIGSTALHLAAGNDERDICRLLIDCPRFTVGVNALNNNGQTPLDFATEFGTGVAVKDLTDAGAESGRPSMRRHVESR